MDVKVQVGSIVLTQLPNTATTITGLTPGQPCTSIMQKAAVGANLIVTGVIQQNTAKSFQCTG